MVARCQASAHWARHVAALSELAEAGIAAWREGSSRSFIEVAGRYGRAMRALGVDAGAPIVTPQIAQVMEAAESVGASAKPSGAPQMADL